MHLVVTRNVMLIMLQSVERLDRIMPLALLHAILLQQSYFGRFAFVHPHYWTLSDLSTAVEVFRLLVQPMPNHDATELIASVYSHHCVDSTDACVVHAIVQDLALQAARPDQVCMFWFFFVCVCFFVFILSCMLMYSFGKPKRYKWLVCWCIVLVKLRDINSLYADV